MLRIFDISAWDSGRRLPSPSLGALGDAGTHKYSLSLAKQCGLRAEGAGDRSGL